MSGVCLLIADTFEPTADLLVAELRRRGVACMRWNLDRYPLEAGLTYRAANGRFEVELTGDGRRLDLADVASVWCRSLLPSGFPEELEAQDRAFAETGARRALDALTTVCDALWVNHPVRQRLANSKPAQLHAARRVGLDIPATVITNDPAAARASIAGGAGETVYKSLSQNLDLDPGTGLYTGVVTGTELANLDLIRLTPGIFQERIAKAYELRVTVVGTRIFSARIDSQARAETALDWRRRPFDVDDRPVDLPAEIEAGVLALMDVLGLVYGAFDFIVTPDGRHVFLEVNPGGQYMWVEAGTGLPITAALADTLAAPCLG